MASMVDVSYVSMKKISITNLKDYGLLLNERDVLVFKCRHKSNFTLPRLEATEVPTLSNSRDIDAGWFLLELITFNSVGDSVIWREDLYKGGDSWKSRYYFKVVFFLIPGVVNSPLTIFRVE